MSITDHSKKENSLVEVNNNRIGNNANLLIGNDNEVYNDNREGIFIELNNAQIDINTLRELIDRTNTLLETDNEYKYFTEELSSLLEHRIGREIIGLEQKLVNGNRHDLLEDALFLENKFSRRVAKGELSRTNQAIYFHCLSKIYSLFISDIKPLINKNIENEIIGKVIENNIVNPIYNEVSRADSSINHLVIHGMIYFLTGKCHIKWEK